MRLRHILIGTIAAGAIAGIAITHPITMSQCHYSGTTVNNVFPDKSCTPGVTDPTLTTSKLCDLNFRTGTIRNVPQSEKDQVAKEYGLPSLKGYEIDHLISLELGGSNDIHNLWPELGFPNPKDKVENSCHKAVCVGAITLQEAQKEISTNWTTACK